MESSIHRVMKKQKNGRVLAIRESKIHGYGVFACKKFKKEQYIATIIGSQVTYKSYFKGQSNRYSNWIGIGKDTWIDPVDEFQYVNHSSNPNAGIKGTRILKVYALRDIELGEEITIDYSITESDKEFCFENSEPDHDKHRKYIGSIHTLPAHIFKSYLPFIPSYFRKIYEKEVLYVGESSGGGM
jgi:SET domain-containing protein